jgi:hypothetical protein
VFGVSERDWRARTMGTLEAAWQFLVAFLRRMGGAFANGISRKARSINVLSL